jgi:hypothetical protein
LSSSLPFYFIYVMTARCSLPPPRSHRSACRMAANTCSLLPPPQRNDAMQHFLTTLCFHPLSSDID